MSHSKQQQQKDWSKVLNEGSKVVSSAKDDAAEEKRADAAADEKAAKTPGLEHPKYAELEQQLLNMESKANGYWNDVLRVKAELENVRRRAERDVADAHKYSLNKFILELLPVIDSLERGLEASVGEEEHVVSLKHGMVMTRDMFLKVVEKFGVQQVDPVGQPFDPELHEAMSVREDATVAPDTVVQVVQKGYVLNGRLLRPALVIVAKKP